MVIYSNKFFSTVSTKRASSTCPNKSNTPQKDTNINVLLTAVTEQLIKNVNYAYSLYHYNNKKQALTGGKLKTNSRDIVENTVRRAIISCATLAGLDKKDYELVKGNTDCVTTSNSGGNLITGLDWYLKIKGKLVLAVECNTGLDSTRMKLVDWIASHLKSKGVTTMAVYMERAIDNLDSAYYLMDGVHDSNKPIYLEEFRKEVNFDSMFRMVTQLYSVIKNSIK